MGKRLSSNCLFGKETVSTCRLMVNGQWTIVNFMALGSAELRAQNRKLFFRRSRSRSSAAKHAYEWPLLFESDGFQPTQPFCFLMSGVNDERLPCLANQTGRNQLLCRLNVFGNNRADVFKVESVATESKANNTGIAFNQSGEFRRSGKHPFQHRASVNAERLFVQREDLRPIGFGQRARRIVLIWLEASDDSFHTAQSAFIREAEFQINFAASGRGIQANQRLRFQNIQSFVQQLCAYALSAFCRINQNHTNPTDALLVTDGRHRSNDSVVFDRHAASGRAERQKQFPFALQLIPPSGSAQSQSSRNVFNSHRSKLNRIVSHRLLPVYAEAWKSPARPTAPAKSSAQSLLCNSDFGRAICRPAWEPRLRTNHPRR